jgi:hypothetical protein
VEDPLVTSLGGAQKKTSFVWFPRRPTVVENKLVLWTPLANLDTAKSQKLSAKANLSLQQVGKQT